MNGKTVSRQLVYSVAMLLICADVAAAPAGDDRQAERDVHASTAAPWKSHAGDQLAAYEYDITWQDETALPGVRGAWHAPNRAHNLRTYFTDTGIRVVPREVGNASWEWGLTLLRYGRPTRVNSVTAASPIPSRNRINFDRGPIVEWYVNDVRGLEQGFTLLSPPPLVDTENTEDGSHSVHLDLSLSGTLDPSFSADGQAIDFKGLGGAAVLRYSHLRVEDARGRELAARMEAFAEAGVRGVRLVFDDDGAVYPVTVDPLTTYAAWTAEGNQAGAQLGISVATAGDVNGDGYSDVVVGAYRYDNGHDDEGRAFVYLGSASGLGTSPVWSTESDQASAFFGWPVAAAGDVNGDGYSDVIVGAYLYDNVETDEGRAYVFLGSDTGLATSPAWTAESNQEGARFGFPVATAGDVNGDGYADVIVGAYLFENGETDEGRAYVYLGSASGLATTPAWTAEGNQIGADFGSAIATAGDVNGDGYSDVIVGAERHDNVETDEGRVYAYLGSASGLASTAAWTVESNQATALLGSSVAAAGDVNGDGYSDVIVGAPFYDNVQGDEGRAYVYLGSTSGLATTPSWTGESNQPTALFGRSVATAGDVNGDGYADVIVGADLFDNGEADEGRAFAYLGSASGLSDSPVWTGEGGQVGAQFGISVATAGDVDGDGYSDILVGASQLDNPETDEGQAYVYLGFASGPATTPAWTVDGDQPGQFSLFGSSVATAGDVNGDGYSDVIVGAAGFDNGQTDEGRAQVHLGSASGLASLAWAAESNQSSASFGEAVATAGDVNGDGFSDVIVGARLYDNGQVDEGRAYVYLGSASGLATTPAWTAESDQAGAFFGFSVATAGDVNGDGFSDVIVGAFEYDNGQTREGRAFVYLGSASGITTAPAWIAEGGLADVVFGHSVATAGDVNGDGYSDVLVGAPGYDNGETDKGRAYVYLGSAFGLANSPAWTAEGDLEGAAFGYSVSTAGDVNGDGYSDVLVGTSAYGGEGRALAYLGSASGLATTPAWTAQEGQPSSFGQSVATAGDVNGDGYSDVIVGAKQFANPEYQEGAAYVYLGSGSGLATSPAWTAEGNQVSALFGSAVATAGDVNGDGYSDVLVGAPLYGPIQRGRVYAYHGNDGDGLDRVPRQARTDGTAPIDTLGRSDSETSFRVRALGRTPLGRGQVRLEAEVKPLGTAFDGSGLIQGAVADTGAPIPATGSAVPLDEMVAGLTSFTPYHWRLRLVTDSPFFPRTPWFSLPYNNPTETDLRTDGCLDGDGDGYGLPGVPTCPAGAATDCDDTNASINPGAAEICDTLDNDCDAQADEDFPGGCTCATPWTGLISFWPGDGNADDVRGGHDGSEQNGLSYVAGRVGQAFSFDGSDDLVGSIGAPSTYSFIQNTGVFSIVAWIRLDDPAALLQQAITGNTQTTAEKGHFFIWENSDGLQRLRVGLVDGTPGVPVLQSTSAANVITDSNWHHVAAVGDGTNVTFYVDGVGAVGTGTIGTLSTGDSTRLMTLGTCGGACPFSGELDEVQIYDQALSSAEILALYAAGGSGACQCTDADGDGYGAEGGLSCPNGTVQDCNDADAVVNPGMPAPDGLAALAAAHSGPDVLLSWAVITDATGYDVVGGDLIVLHITQGNFAVATDQCLANDLASTSATDPAAGASRFYLVRPVNCGGNGSYGGGFRDAGIQAAAVTCP